MSIKTKHINIFRLLVLLTLMIVSLTGAFADDLISSRSYWEDESNQASLAKAQVQVFKPYSNVLSRGYTQSAVWIQLKVSPPEGMNADDKLILRIRPIYLALRGTDQSKPA